MKIYVIEKLVARDEWEPLGFSIHEIDARQEMKEVQDAEGGKWRMRVYVRQDGHRILVRDNE